MMESGIFFRKFKELWYGETEKTIPPNQDKCFGYVYDEFEWYMWLISCIKNPVVVEIGAGDGRQGKFYRELLGTKQYITVDISPDTNPMVLGDSSLIETQDKVKGILAGPIDILFINDNHSQLELWEPLIRDGGLVGIGGTHRDGGIKIWDDRSEKYESWDIHTEQEGKQYGIGLFKKSAVSDGPPTMTSGEFMKRAWDQWYIGQTPAERAKIWYPQKRPRQVAVEFLRYLYMVSSIRNPRVVEIGVATGFERPFYEDLLNAKQYITVDIDPETKPDVVGNSIDPVTVKSVMDKLDGPVDIIFIDGSHDREIAPRDWQLWTPIVRSGGYVGLDDSHHDHASYCDGSAKVWNKIKSRYDEVWDLFEKCTPEHPALPMTKNRAKYKQAGVGVLRVP